MRLGESVRRVAQGLFGSRALVALWVTIAVALVAVTVTGGFAAAPAPATPSVSAGELVDLGPVQFAADGWTVRDDVESSALENVEGASAWLIIEGEATARTSRTTSFPDSALVPPAELLIDGAGTNPERVVLMRGLTSAPQLQPGLPERLTLFWPVPAEAQPDQAAELLDLRLVRSYLDDSRIDASRVWRVSGTAAVVSVPRDDEIGGELVDEDGEF